MKLHPLARITTLAAAVLSLAGSVCAQGDGIPEPIREFRGAWIASVSNINWPSRKGMSSVEQQAELRSMLDKCQSIRINAIVLQVRPAADALYASKLEPWSHVITGTQGQPPSPYYDPLEFAVTEAHKRGMQLHAWLNPYRAAENKDMPMAANHVSRKIPAAALKLDKYLWLDPGNKEAQEHTAAVVRDIVTRYDVDGIHFDDYFYPYASYVKAIGGFPDQASYQAYKSTGGTMSLEDWRRDNVNQLMARCYRETKQIKPHCMFGIAPFGIWRPGYPEGISGMDQYAELYADAKKWFNEGWVDYMAPQLYWDLSKPKQSFPKLLAWWAGENSKGRHLWPGISISGVGKDFQTDDILKRIEMTRQMPRANGQIWWSIAPILKNQGGIMDALGRAYASPALIPKSPWLDGIAPQPVVAQAERDAKGDTRVSWTPARDRDAFVYALYAKINGNWQMDVVPFGSSGYTVPASLGTPQGLAVSVVDRTGNESRRTIVGGAAAANPMSPSGFGIRSTPAPGAAQPNVYNR